MIDAIKIEAIICWNDAITLQPKQAKYLDFEKVFHGEKVYFIVHNDLIENILDLYNWINKYNTFAKIGRRKIEEKRSEQEKDTFTNVQEFNYFKKYIESVRNSENNQTLDSRSFGQKFFKGVGTNFYNIINHMNQTGRSREDVKTFAREHEAPLKEPQGCLMDDCLPSTYSVRRSIPIGQRNLLFPYQFGKVLNPQLLEVRQQPSEPFPQSPSNQEEKWLSIPVKTPSPQSQRETADPSVMEGFFKDFPASSDDLSTDVQYAPILDHFGNNPNKNDLEKLRDSFMGRQSLVYEDFKNMGDSIEGIEFDMSEEEFQQVMQNRGKIYPSRLDVRWRCTRDPNHGTFLKSYWRINQSKCPKCPIIKPSRRISYKDYTDLANSRNDLGHAMCEEEFNNAISSGGRDVKPSKVKLKWVCMQNPNHGTWKASYESIRSGSGCPKCTPKASLSYSDFVRLGASKKNFEFATSPEEFTRAMRNRVAVPSKVKLKWKCLLNQYHGTWKSDYDSITRTDKCPKCRGISYEDCIELGNSRDDLDFDMNILEFQRAINNCPADRKSRVKINWICTQNPNHGTWKASYESIRSGSGCPICGQRLPLIGTYVHPILEYYILKLLQLKGIRSTHEDTILLDRGFQPDLIIWRNEQYMTKIEKYQNVLKIPQSIKKIAIDFTYSLNPSVILEKCHRLYQSNERYLIIVLLSESPVLNPFFFENLITQDNTINFSCNIRVINYKDFIKSLGPLDTDQEKSLIKNFLEARILGLHAIKSDDFFINLKDQSEKYRALLTNI